MSIYYNLQYLDDAIKNQSKKIFFETKTDSIEEITPLSMELKEVLEHLKLQKECIGRHRTKDKEANATVKLPKIDVNTFS